MGSTWRCTQPAQSSGAIVTALLERRTSSRSESIPSWDLLTLAQTGRRPEELVTQGIHPAHQRRTERLTRHAESANTFETVAREWMEKRGATWGPSYAHQVTASSQATYFRTSAALPIRSVTAAHLLSIIRQVEARNAISVALLLRQWCSTIFRYGVSTLRADSDPAASIERGPPPAQNQARQTIIALRNIRFREGS